MGGADRRARRAADLRTGPVRPPVVGPLFVGHDRPAEGDRPRPRRRRPRAFEGDRPDVRHPRRRPDVLVHHDRLDDVELPGRLDARRRRAGPLRRQPRLPEPGASCGTSRRARGSACSGRARRSSAPARRPASGPATTNDLSHLEAIGSTGSPLAVETFGWVYDAVKPDVWLASMSGGTDVVSRVRRRLSAPAGPRRRAPGARARGAGRGLRRGRSVGRRRDRGAGPDRAAAIDAGRRSGTTPTGRRYRESYFEMYPGVWRHGDWIRITERGSAVIEGRSDSTLNRQGIRFGTSELYGVVESLPEVARQPRHRPRAAGRPATGCRSSSCSPTASSLTPR